MLAANKYMIALLIAAVTVCTGFASLRFIRRYQRFIQIADAVTDGIFLGTAFFHLLPTAWFNLQHNDDTFSYLLCLLLLLSGFSLFWLIEKLSLDRHPFTHGSHGWLLSVILSAHALIAGIVIGLTQTMTALWILCIAIVAHKGFETFALVTAMQRCWQDRFKIQLLLLLFTLITPLGIVLATIFTAHFHTQNTSLPLACFNAFAAGTFIYIGIFHIRHQHVDHCSTAISWQRKWLATFIGTAVMAVLAMWV